MPLVKKIIKQGPREVVIKWTGNGSDLLTLASLVGTGQTVTGAPLVSIVGASTSQDGNGVCAITRNNEVALNLFGNFATNPKIKLPINENGTTDINVSLSSNGTLILHLLKTQGYSGI